ncbi:MAG: hypothetical protein M0R75_01520 [Dehalococcoidia bacterium]|nr:hypothetical protein [Dehalococcoidia bacterium]
MSARFRWTDSAGDHEVVLARPLMRVAPRARRLEWRSEAHSGVIHTERSASTVYEIEGTIRFHADPMELVGMLSARLGRPITYAEERGGLLLTWTGLLMEISPGGDWVAALEPDADRYSHGEYSAMVRLRRRGGETYEALFEALQPAFLVEDGSGGYQVATTGPGDVVIVDDGHGGLTFAASGTEVARLADMRPSTGPSYELFEIA